MQFCHHAKDCMFRQREDGRLLRAVWDLILESKEYVCKFLQRTLSMLGCSKPRHWKMIQLHPEFRSLAHTEDQECFCKTSSGWGIAHLVSQFSWIQQLRVQQETLSQKWWIVIKEDTRLNVCLWFSHLHTQPCKHGYYTPPPHTPIQPIFHLVFLFLDLLIVLSDAYPCRTWDEMYQF